MTWTLMVARFLPVIGSVGKNLILFFEFIMNCNNSGAQSFSSDSTHFNFFKFQKLLGCSEEFLDNHQTIHKTVKSFEYQMFLKIPSFGFFVFFEVGGKFSFEFTKSISKSTEILQSQNDFIQGFFYFNLFEKKIVNNIGTV